MGSLAKVRILVSGASGFIGAHLTWRLIQEGAQVFALTEKNQLGNLPIFLKEQLKKVNIFQVDLKDYPQLKSIAEKVRPQKVYHLAAFVNLERTFSNVQRCIETNIKGTVNLLQAFERVGCEVFIHSGTCEVYGNGPIPFREEQPIYPISPYAISKACGEFFCQMYQQLYQYPVVMLRLSTVYGPGQNPERLIPSVILSCLRKEKIEVSSGKQKRDFTYVKDMVDGFIRASTTERAIGQIINLGDKKGCSIESIVNRIVRKIDPSLRPVFGARKERPFEARNWCSSNDRAWELLDWKPRISLDEGLERTIRYYREVSRWGEDE